MNDATRKAVAPRNLVDVVKAMVAALRAEALPVRDAQGQVVSMPLLIGSLERVASDASFTAPEVMRVRWADLVLEFNAAAFGTRDEAGWDRSKAPKWSERAGRILAGKEG